MVINKETRRRHISFKNNIQDKDLLKFFDEKSEVYGRSNYIKILIQQAMFKEQIGKNKQEEYMKNTLGDLNNHLFMQLERLNDEDVKGEQLTEEIERSKAITNIAKEIIANGTLVLQAKKLQDGKMNIDDKLPKMLEG